MAINHTTNWCTKGSIDENFVQALLKTFETPHAEGEILANNDSIINDILNTNYLT